MYYGVNQVRKYIIAKPLFEIKDRFLVQLLNKMKYKCHED